MTKYIAIVKDQLDGAMNALAESRTNADFGTPEFGQLIANVRDLSYLISDLDRMAAIEAAAQHDAGYSMAKESPETPCGVSIVAPETGEVNTPETGVPTTEAPVEGLAPLTRPEARAKLAKLRTAGKPVLDVMFGLFGDGTKLSEVPEDRLAELVKAVEEAE